MPDTLTACAVTDVFRVELDRGGSTVDERAKRCQKRRYYKNDVQHGTYFARTGGYLKATVFDDKR